jgi:ABC-type sulfate transport system permease subunit
VVRASSGGTDPLGRLALVLTFGSVRFLSQLIDERQLLFTIPGQFLPTCIVLLEHFVPAVQPNLHYLGPGLKPAGALRMERSGG